MYYIKGKFMNSTHYILLLGANLGDIQSTITKAIEKLISNKCSIIKKSSYYKTKAWGITEQPDFINICISVNANYTPTEMLQLCLQIESELGRERKNEQKWNARIIDIDILFASQHIIKLENLIIPHPYFLERYFAIVPAAEIEPDYVHPIVNKSLAEISTNFPDKTGLEKLNE
jgi:2-amino-4-hydroxy-6-hydroxymethyldihydropteridine diphosphokinase